MLQTPIRPSFPSITPPPPPNPFTTHHSPLLSPLSPPLPLPLYPLVPVTSEEQIETRQISSLATRRFKNLKKLSLNVPPPLFGASGGGGGTIGLRSPVAPGFGVEEEDEEGQGGKGVTSRSLPPSPAIEGHSFGSGTGTGGGGVLLLSNFLGAEGSEAEDRTIGKLMLRQVEERMRLEGKEMREQMRGGRGMARRKSITRLVLPPPTSVSSSMTGGRIGLGGVGTGVRMIRRDGRESFDPSCSSTDSLPPFSTLSSSSTPTSTPSALNSSFPPSAQKEEQYPYQHGPREILPNIFLGSEATASDLGLLQEFGIGWTLNVAKEVVCPWDFDSPAELIQEGREEGMSSPNVRTPVTPSMTITMEPRPPFIRPTASTPNLHSLYSLPSAPIYSPIIPKLKSSHKSFPQMQYLHLPWGHDESDLVESSKFSTAFEFIDLALKSGGKILIQCQCGVSRSATVMIGYCMREAWRLSQLEEQEGGKGGKGERGEGGLERVRGMHDAYSFVKEKSAWIGPNLSTSPLPPNFSRLPLLEQRKFERD